jgi:hypothetical protein
MMQQISYANNTFSEFLSQSTVSRSFVCLVDNCFVDVGGNFSITNQVNGPNEGMLLVLPRL